MPICAAIIAAALLSGPAGAPADQNHGADVSPGKQIAKFVMQNADQPELIADKALELMNSKGPKIGPLLAEMDGQAPNAQGAAQSPNGPVAQGPQYGPNSQGAGDQGTQGPIIRTAANPGPHDIYLHPQANKPMVGTISGKDLAEQKMPGQQFSDFGGGYWSSDDK